MDNIFLILAGIIAVLTYQLNKKRVNEKLTDSKIEDAKLATEEANIKDKIKEVKEKLDNQQTEKAKELSSEDVVKFWKGNLK